MRNDFRREQGLSNKTRHRACAELVVIENVARPAADDASICDYISSMVSELSALSEKMNEEILVYLLNLTAQEARNAMNRKRGSGLQVSGLV